MEFGGEVVVPGGSIVNPGPVPTPDITPNLETALFNYVNELKFCIDIQDIILILASVVGVGMLFFLAWLGVRKATRTFTTAVSTGKIKI